MSGFLGISLIKFIRQEMEIRYYLYLRYLEVLLKAMIISSDVRTNVIIAFDFVKVWKKIHSRTFLTYLS